MYSSHFACAADDLPLINSLGHFFLGMANHMIKATAIEAAINSVRKKRMVGMVTKHPFFFVLRPSSSVAMVTRKGDPRSDCCV